MTPPSVPVAVWLWSAFDPVLVIVAVLLGWKADQAGKLIIAAIVALVVAVLFSWMVTGLNIPWIAPVSHDSPTLLPVRVVAALIWAAGAYAVRRAMGR
ncbi:hypothetical protein [Microvirga sp. 17 mud 1-3]|uniref:hypothetical protein n=1 Tax=Microvirga sp. 17 mud 1-3 TaxID=2082949 RepID=UPI000D6DA896|nr:hypothetical protein [Microvirga sp. 17 mud 1-3]AWM89074.1 hypothetical protein C4E04_08870 [Microvirga sp. 17 mud 1-3]